MPMDQITALAVAIAGLLSPIIIQVCKRWIPKDWRASFAVAVSLVVACAVLAASGSLHKGDWFVALTAAVGIAQAVYTIVAKLVDTTTDLAPQQPQTATRVTNPVPMQTPARKPPQEAPKQPGGYPLAG